MKRIIAVIRQDKYEEVKNALLSIGCEGMNVSEVQGDVDKLAPKNLTEVLISVLILSQKQELK